MHKMTLFSRRMVTVLTHTSTESLELPSERLSAAVLTRHMSILQKICFELSYASQFAKGYLFASPWQLKDSNLYSTMA